MVGPFRHLSSLKQKHRADCPLFSATDFEKTQSLAFPTIPFMSRTVELFFSLYSNPQVTSFSVSYYPTVRRAGSPAFALFHDALGEAKREVCEFRAGFQSGGTQIRAGSWREAHPTFNELQLSLQKIPAKLEAMFKSGEAMPRERDEFGNTLLFVCLIARVTLQPTHTDLGTSVYLPNGFRNHSFVTPFPPTCRRDRNPSHQFWGGCRCDDSLLASILSWLLGLKYFKIDINGR
jgi:hypothetical protein